MLKNTIVAIGIATSLAALAGFTTFAPPFTSGVDGVSDQVHRVDFGEVKTQLEPVYDAELAPVVDAKIKEFRIPITHETIEIASGATYEGWTFGGTVPGRFVRALSCASRSSTSRRCRIRSTSIRRASR